MRPSATCLILGAALAVGGLLSPATSAQEVEQKAQFSPPPYVPMSGTCTMEISPDKALIVGGVSSSALKPSEAVDQLERQLALMRSYIAEKHGELQMLERVRTIKNPQPGKEDTEPPFQVVQRLQATFPTDAPVDAILQKLIELGLDRFGDNVLNNYNRREAVIRFRVSDFDERMNDFQQRCAADAWKQWCATAGSEKDCASPPPPASLEPQAFNVRSKETLMRADGNSAPWQWNMNRGQRSADPPDLLGNVTVHLEGFVNLTYHAVVEKP